MDEDDIKDEEKQDAAFHDTLIPRWARCAACTRGFRVKAVASFHSMLVDLSVTRVNGAATWLMPVSLRSYVIDPEPHWQALFTVVGFGILKPVNELLDHTVLTVPAGRCICPLLHSEKREKLGGDSLSAEQTERQSAGCYIGSGFVVPNFEPRASVLEPVPMDKLDEDRFRMELEQERLRSNPERQDQLIEKLREKYKDDPDMSVALAKDWERIQQERKEQGGE